MVQLLREKGIADTAVLTAILHVPRHFFFETAFEQHAYQDKAWPIGNGQTISQPYTVARQTELLQVSPGCKILEIGTGSGYQAAVLAELKVVLHTIEFHKELAEKAARTLPVMGYNPFFYCGDGSLGLPEHAPFNGIIVTAGAPGVPQALMAQLALGGRLVIPVGSENNQKMLRITRNPNGTFTTEEFGKYSFVPLRGKQGWDA